MTIAIGILIIIMIILVDQITKFLTTTYMTLGQTHVVIPYVFELRFARNFGAAWGMMEGRWYIFFIVTIIALGLFGYLFSQNDFKTKRLYSASTIMLIGGTFGNALDRLFRVAPTPTGFFGGYVVDMLHLPFLDYIIGRGNNFVFNIADVALVFGLIFFAIDVFFLEGKRKRRQAETNKSVVIPLDKPTDDTYDDHREEG